MLLFSNALFLLKEGANRLRASISSISGLEGQQMLQVQTGLDSKSKMVKGKLVMHDESDVRVTKKFNDKRHQQVKSSPQEEVLKLY